MVALRDPCRGTGARHEHGPPVSGATTWSVLLCEGFNDRDFLGGVLEMAGGKDGRDISKPDGTKVAGHGRQAWLFGKHLVEICPVEGKPSSTFDRLAEQLVVPGRSPQAIVFVRDADLDAPAGAKDVDKKIHGHIERLRRDLSPRGPTPSLLGFGWWTGDAVDSPGIPNKQTLERLLCAAWTTALPEAGASIDSWLRADPAHDTLMREDRSKSLTHKNQAKSWYAKYTAADGEGYFYGKAWARHAIVRTAVLQRLETRGALPALRQLIPDLSWPLDVEDEQAPKAQP